MAGHMARAHLDAAVRAGGDEAGLLGVEGQAVHRGALGAGLQRHHGAGQGAGAREVVQVCSAVTCRRRQQALGAGADRICSSAA
jgi:hypothetical protein